MKADSAHTPPWLQDGLARIAVVGGGVMGRRIALHFASRGPAVRLYEPSPEQRNDAAAYVAAELAGGSERGSVAFTDSVEQAASDAQLVIETVPEQRELKRDVLGQLDHITRPEAVLATNSSSYASRELIERVMRPQRVVNLHFFQGRNEPVLPCVEVMSCGETHRSIIELLATTLPSFGLEMFECRAPSTGFLFNRVWAAIKRESLAVMAEGVGTPQEFDRLWTIVTGAPTGPFRLMDMVGLDVVLEIEEHYAAERLGLPEAPRRLLRQYVDEGRLGAKTGSGFYQYGAQ